MTTAVEESEETNDSEGRCMRCVGEVLKPVSYMRHVSKTRGNAPPALTSWTWFLFGVVLFSLLLAKTSVRQKYQ
jgi:hypothetical protein